MQQRAVLPPVRMFNRGSAWQFSAFLKGDRLRTRRGLEVLGILLTVAVAVLGVVPSAQAATVGGTVDTIDLAKNNITLKESDGTKLTLGVKPFTRIIRNSASTELSGLALNDSITAQYFGQTALRLTATGAVVTTASGPIVALSTGTGKITIGSTTIQTSAHTKISRNGKVVSLGQLTLNDTAVAHLSSGAASSAVKSEDGEDDADDVVADGPEESEVKGTITAVPNDPNAPQQITITPTDGEAPVTVTVDSSTFIEVGGEPATLADLQVGQTAEAEFDPVTLIAFSIQVDIPDTEDEGEISGTVAAVDVNAGTLTITPTGGGTNVVLKVTAATEIEVNGENATLADVKVDMPVKAEFDTTTLVATEVKAGSECEDSQDGGDGCGGGGGD